MEGKVGKILPLIIAIIAVIALAGIAIYFGNKNKVTNIEGTLEELMDKMYATIPEDKMPMLQSRRFTMEEQAMFLGNESNIEFSEAIVSEPMISSIPHSVVLIRTQEGSDVETIKQSITNTVDPRKWICVEAENVSVLSKGNLIALIMVSEHSDTIVNNFNNM